jgi:short-subunit dehydrogenase
MVDLHNQVAIVTGASSGIGAALAKGFSQAGSKVVLAARRPDRLKEAAEACSGETLICVADVTRDRDRRDIVRRTVDRWSRVDILVNNAGMGMYGDFMSATEADWRRLFDINFFATVLMTQTVLPVMEEQGRGLILNMASIGGLVAHAEKAIPYIASKHAVLGFSRGLAKDFTGTGIRVLAACPHLTSTEFFSVSPGAEKMAPVVERYRSFMDTPEEVARGILDQLDLDRLVVFPTGKPAEAYERQRDI